YIGGFIYLEHGFTKADDITSFFSQCNFNYIIIVKDLNNNDRCTKALLGYL
ncbi:peptide chain release factor N(5)-glutamine methyltransferase, partial [Francisella tularensis subsp. holarctica]|nr:peptide chain release factor N(5)-glutamine methyltransferase [Francisella tularensis subsp. holarctica]